MTSNITQARQCLQLHLFSSSVVKKNKILLLKWRCKSCYYSWPQRQKPHKQIKSDIVVFGIDFNSESRFFFYPKFKLNIFFKFFSFLFCSVCFLMSGARIDQSKGAIFLLEAFRNLPKSMTACPTAWYYGKLSASCLSLFKRKKI